MRGLKLCIWLLIIPCMGFAQQKPSKGDISFFEYAYRRAIVEYRKEQNKGGLTTAQYLNLADSYLKVGNYKEASNIYRDVFKKDSSMSAGHFNRLLQSISKTEGLEKVKLFLNNNQRSFSVVVLENAEFNYELLQSKNKLLPGYGVFNVSANSAQADFSPSFYKDKVLFSSGRPRGSKKVYNPSGEAYLNIYEAEVDANGNLKNTREFGGLMASSFHKATPYYAAELNSIFYSLSNADGAELLFSTNGKNAMSIGKSSGPDSHLYILRDLDTSFYYPFYDATTGRLYFAANFKDSYGGTDIYYVHTNNGIIMSSPINLGPRINSPGNEIAPFIFDGSLFFSSDVFYGLGGMDVYRSNMKDGNSFSIPVNLGAPINSPEDDFGLIIKTKDSGELIGYFASNRPGGRGNDDIYGIHMLEKPGLKTLAIKGAVKKPLGGGGIEEVVISLLDKEGAVLKEVITDKEGRYQVEIPWRDTITLTAYKERYSQYREQFNAAALDTINTSKFNLDLMSIDDILDWNEERKVIKLNKFYFDKGKSEITPFIATELDKVVAIAKGFPELQLKVESHTDSRGSNSYNLKLSQRRSDAIKDYLMQQGVPSSALVEVVGYGEEQLLNNCKNGVFCLEMLHNRNERSSVIILNYNDLFGSN